MSSVVLIGAQWGDEGKGKVVDHLTKNARWVVRYAGGPNAGHTLVVAGEKFIVRLIPSGILRPETRCVLAQGMVIDADVLVGEMDALEKRGKLLPGQLLLSERSHLILPVHILVDGLREGGKGAIGTTKRGVGPTYEDKAARRGIRAGLLRDPEALKAAVASTYDAWAPVVAHLGGTMPSPGDAVSKLLAAAPRLVPLLSDTALVVFEAMTANENVLFEGAQGTLLDIDHGTYPYVTSSTAVAGGACAGAGIGPSRIDRVLGIAKAYVTRVGGGPFPTELMDETGERLRTIGGEFGSVTGRPRRTGWLDLPALRYAARVNGLDGIALSKLDVLSDFDEIAVCTGYETRHGLTTGFPVDDLAEVRPHYNWFRGWKSSLDGVRSRADLPEAARTYVDFIEREAGVKIVLIGTGASREATLEDGDLWANRRA